MILKWRKSESTERPSEVDSSSSEKTVYLRRNIRTEVRENEQGTETTMYVYEEAKLSRNDYLIYLAEKNDANTEYMVMMLT